MNNNYYVKDCASNDQYLIKAENPRDFIFKLTQFMLDVLVVSEKELIEVYKNNLDLEIVNLDDLQVYE